MMDRAIRAAKVEPALYEEVERDENATTEAGIIVAIAALASAIGAAVLTPSTFVGTFIGTLLSALLGWVLWSYITYYIGTRVMNGTATPGELLRTIGYAQPPQLLGILAILGVIPILGWLIVLLLGLVLLIWSIWAGIVAVRQALDFDTMKAAITVIIGAIPFLILRFIIAAIFRF